MKVTFERDDEILTFEVASLPAFDIVSRMLNHFDIIKMNGDYARDLFKAQEPAPAPPAPPAPIVIDWTPVQDWLHPITHIPVSQPFYGNGHSGLVDQPTRVDDVEVGEVWHDAQGNDITETLKAAMAPLVELTRDTL
jgi:hypothetical protein